MDELKKPTTVEHIRDTLLMDIKLQEEVRLLFRRILKRLTRIYIGVAILMISVFILGTSLIIYILNQRTIIESNKINITKTRKQLNSVIQTQDSIQLLQDSVLQELNSKK